MKILWNSLRSRAMVLPEQRKINFRSTQTLLTRRKRVRQRFSLLLAAIVGLGSLLLATD